MSILTPNFPFILHGGDYNPEQFPEEVWDRDVELMAQTHVNVATLPVFGWGNIQKGEHEWDFGWLDSVIEKLHKGGIKVCLATATAATPPWVDQTYPDILRVGPDGIKVRHGGRHTFCPHSENFRRLSTGLARKMAERYGHHPAVLLWHVSNEYGNSCYCDKCSAAFRTWLQSKYGTVSEVNHRWNMAFWGQTYTDWSQIEAPIASAQRNFQGLLIDYDRFQSASILDCCRAEVTVLREITPDIPITTNFMGAFKPLDYHDWAKELDIISWDSYPPRGVKPSTIAFDHSLMRGLREGQPWMLMEQTPSQQNWQQYNSLKSPGILKLWSFQALAHGAEAIMYFQWRRSPGAQEMFHGAVVEHAGRTDARVFQEVVSLGADLEKLGASFAGTRVAAQVALLFDWENWWAVDYSSGPSIELKYADICRRVHAALHGLGVTVDVVSPTADLSKYGVVVAPVLKMVKPGVAERLEEYVAAGGRFVTTFFSGLVDETDRAFTNGYPGPLAKLLGIWVEETDALAPYDIQRVHLGPDVFSAGILCDIIRLEGAEATATYTENFYAEWPAATLNTFGKGEAIYLGTMLEDAGLTAFFGDILARAGVTPWTSTPSNVEIVVRVGADGQEFAFLLNHGVDRVTVDLPAGRYLNLLTDAQTSGSVHVERYGVCVLKRVS